MDKNLLTAVVYSDDNYSGDYTIDYTMTYVRRQMAEEIGKLLSERLEIKSTPPDPASPVPKFYSNAVTRHVARFYVFTQAELDEYVSQIIEQADLMRGIGKLIEKA